MSSIPRQVRVPNSIFRACCIFLATKKRVREPMKQLRYSLKILRFSFFVSLLFFEIAIALGNKFASHSFCTGLEISGKNTQDEERPFAKTCGALIFPETLRRELRKKRTLYLGIP